MILRTSAWVCMITLGMMVSAADPEAEAEKTGTAPPATEKVALKLVLPPVVYAVPGIETNIYFDNVILAVNPRAFAVDVTCNRGMHQNERWTYTPTEEDVGQFTLRLDVSDEWGKLVASQETIIRVTSALAGKDKATSILIMGDSLTAATAYPKQVHDNCQSENGPILKMIGTVCRYQKPDGPVCHEGYGGWTCQRFMEHFVSDDMARTGQSKIDGKPCGSPFIYAGDDGKGKVDFARYCREYNSGAAPDVVTILLGCNDTFSSTDDTIEQRIDSMFKYYDQLVVMIHGVSKDTKIGCLLLVPPAATQDAFGANYKCGQTRWQYKKNQFRVVERMLEHFGGREAEGIHIIPANVMLDCENNYPKRSAPWNARTEVKGTRLSNGVHPAADGYKQIGDAIYCWLKSILK